MCRGAFWSYLPVTSLPKKRSWSSHSRPGPKVCGVFLRIFSPPTDDVHAVQSHVTWWDCAYLNVFAASFCCACAAAEWANEHWVKCRPSCVLTGTGGVPLRSHFRTHQVLCTVLWSSVICSVFVTIQRLIVPQSCQLYSVLIRRLLFISHCRLRWHSQRWLPFNVLSKWGRRNTLNDFWRLWTCIFCPLSPLFLSPHICKIQFTWKIKGHVALMQSV